MHSPFSYAYDSKDSHFFLCDRSMTPNWFVTVWRKTRFAFDGGLVDYNLILEGTESNCNGGATSWGAWISCEEAEGGRAWQVDPPTGERHPGVMAFGEDGCQFEASPTRLTTSISSSQRTTSEGHFDASGPIRLPTWRLILGTCCTAPGKQTSSFLILMHFE
jgi:hypothetical protein